MQLGTNGKDLIKSHEGYRSKAYQDVVGVWTIGWGHTATAREGMEISRAQAEQLLDSDVETAVQAVNVYVIGRGVALTQNQFDALVSLVFNLGSHAIFTKQYNNGYPYGSTLYNKLLVKDYDGAQSRFKDFNKAGGQVWSGLTRRRAQEAALFGRGKGEILLNAVFGLVAASLFYWYMSKGIGL